MKIIKFNWDNQKGEDVNGNHLIIGQHLPKSQNEELTHCEVYGISLDIIDSSKDYMLKRISCYGGNIVGEIKEISKQDARDLLIKEIDKALEVLFNKTEIISIDKNLNIDKNTNEE